MSLRSSRLALVGHLVAVACVVRCGDPDGAGPTADAGAGSTSCPIPSQKPAGGCCGAGQAYVATSAQCEGVGPPGCAANVLNDPSNCVPRWCARFVGKDNRACEPATAGCVATGAACSDAEVAAGGGCPAGTFPLGGNSCVPAGHFIGSGVDVAWDGKGGVLPPVPPLETAISQAVPPLTGLPKADDTFLCKESAAADTRFCTASELQQCRRGPQGQWPDTDKCLYLGVPWPAVCPPGFVVDASATVVAPALPPCKADPADCGLGPWPTLDGAGPALYVDAAVGHDGNAGSAAAPFKSIGKALASATGNATIAIAAGTYTEALQLTKPVKLRGRCAALTHLVAPPSLPKAALGAGAAGLGVIEVSGLRVSGTAVGLEIGPATAVKLQRVWIDKATAFAVVAHGQSAELQARDAVFADTQPVPGNNNFGLGIEAMGGAQVNLEDTRVSGHRGSGLVVHDQGTTLTANRLLVDGNRARANDKTGGRGIEVHGGAMATLTQVRVANNRERGVLLSDTKTLVTASRIVVDGTLDMAKDKTLGMGVSVQTGARLLLSDARLSGNRFAGLTAYGAGSSLEATRLIIDNTQAEATDGLYGTGLTVSDGAQAKVAQLRLSANTGYGLQVMDPQTAVDAQGLLIDASMPLADGSDGQGATIAYGAQLLLQDARLTSNRYCGMVVSDANTLVIANRIVVDATLASAKGSGYGEGVVAQLGAALSLQDVRLAGNREAGLSIDGAGTTLDAQRLVIDDTVPRDSDGLFGVGLIVNGGARAKVDSARLSGNRYMGIYVTDPNTSLDAIGVLVDGTQPHAKLQTFGRGIGVQSGARLDLRGSAVIGNYESGLAAIGDAKVVAAGVALSETQPTASDNVGGVGLWLAGKCTAILNACLLRNHHSAALAVDGSQVFGDGLALVQTAWGDAVAIDSNGKPTGKVFKVADGVLFYNASGSQLARSVLFGNGRAGVMATGSAGVTLDKTVVNASGGAFGVVEQAGSTVVLKSSPVYGATQQNRSGDAGLAVPAAPALVEPPAALPGKK